MKKGTSCRVTSSSYHTCSDTSAAGDRGESTNLGCRIDSSPLVPSAGGGVQLSLGVYMGWGQGVLSLSVIFGNNHG